MGQTLLLCCKPTYLMNHKNSWSRLIFLQLSEGISFILRHNFFNTSENIGHIKNLFRSKLKVIEI